MLAPREVDQLVHLMRPLAELVQRRASLDQSDFQGLLRPGGLARTAWAIRELQSWAGLLSPLLQDSSESAQHEALRQLVGRGVPEAHARLGVEVARVSGTTSRTATPVVVSAERIAFGELESDQAVSTTLTVSGGPGRIRVGSDRMTVSPARFGPSPTAVTIRITPIGEGILWASILIEADSQTVEVPVTARWRRPTGAHDAFAEGEEFLCPTCGRLVPLSDVEEGRCCHACAAFPGGLDASTTTPPTIGKCPLCEARVSLTDSGSTACPYCGWRFSVDALGHLVSGRPKEIECPICQRTLKGVIEGPATCPYCNWAFAVDGEGRLTAGQPVVADCPACRVHLRGVIPGKTECPVCAWSFQINEGGEVVVGQLHQLVCEKYGVPFRAAGLAERTCRRCMPTDRDPEIPVPDQSAVQMTDLMAALRASLVAKERPAGEPREQSGEAPSPDRRTPTASRTSTRKLTTSARESFLISLEVLKGGNVEKAIEHLWRATRLDPKMADAWYQLGSLYGRSGNRNRVVHIHCHLEHLSSTLAKRLELEWLQGPKTR